MTYELLKSLLSSISIANTKSPLLTFDEFSTNLKTARNLPRTPLPAHINFRNNVSKPHSSNSDGLAYSGNIKVLHPHFHKLTARDSPHDLYPRLHIPPNNHADEPAQRHFQAGAFGAFVSESQSCRTRYQLYLWLPSWTTRPSAPTYLSKFLR